MTSTRIRRSDTKVILACRYHPSPLGQLRSTWTANGLWSLNWQAPSDDPPAEPPHTAEPSGRDIGLLIADLSRALDLYFADGDATGLADMTIDDTGWPPFFREVYRACQAIAPGETILYSQLAAAAGRPAAVRAVGQAMARNRLLLVIPCHRVVSRQGLRGFSAPGGLKTKQWLLDLERRPERRPDLERRPTCKSKPGDAGTACL